ncbi:transmembrane protein [Thraustotheca clavata]|uniref:Transmembrane protein n=1 Tax=Thraustotheca clavata TaxID=74557 RepID=A0A1V9ZXG9_9STRA|nr:transmembrane protein [Thraustotheca clavata]
MSISWTSSLWRDTTPKLSSTASDIILEDERYYTRRIQFVAPTPEYRFSDDGALQPGGPVSFTSRPFLGLLSQNIGIGILLGMFRCLSYPVFTVYLGLEGSQIATYDTIVSLAYGFKIFMAILSDCAPFGRARRKPYILLGWLLATASCLAMSCISFPSSRRAEDRKDTDNRLPPGSAPFLILTLLAGIGYVLVIVTSDAIMVYYAQREAMDLRGKTQSVVYTARELSRIVPTIFCGVFLNSSDYGGNFDFSVTPNVPYMLLTWVCVMTLISAIFLLEEPQALGVFVLSDYMNGIWKLIQRNIMAQICLFRFFSEVSFNFHATPTPNIAHLWIKVEPFYQSLFNLLGCCVYAITLSVCGRYGVSWSWRKSIIIATAFAVAIDAARSMLAVHNITRSQFLYLGLGDLENIPVALRYITTMYSAVELADLGNEALVYSIITTWANLGVPVAAMLFKTIDSYYDVSVDKITKDNATVRTQVMYTYILSYGIQLAGLSALIFLPDQKAEVQRLKQNGRSRIATGVIMALALVIIGVFQFVVNMLPLLDSMSCLHLLGGPGCR